MGGGESEGIFCPQVHFFPNAGTDTDTRGHTDLLCNCGFLRGGYRGASFVPVGSDSLLGFPAVCSEPSFLQAEGESAVWEEWTHLYGSSKPPVCVHGAVGRGNK